MGIGDRFGMEGAAQLAALQTAREDGIDIVPVWNKSHREHTIVGSLPAEVREEADAAVRECGWNGNYYVDADHIGLDNVELVLDACDFFTLDVADVAGQPAAPGDIEAFVNEYSSLSGNITVPSLEHPLRLTEAKVRQIAGQYLRAVQEAGRIYRRIEEAKGRDAFVTEVSMDETERPQTPEELLVILAMIAREGIPAQTIAPKFSGRFNKGVDYVGSVDDFTREFDEDLGIVEYAVSAFCLPENLKLSVHSGSDKFSLYGPMGDCLRKFDAGVHLKTAGTTWLEEVIGLAAAGGSGLDVARRVYLEALDRFDEMCAPYAPVIDIDPDKLPSATTVAAWSGAEFAAALRHDPACPDFNPHLRQLLHVAYKIAAEMGESYRTALAECRDSVAANVTENLYVRHIRRIFG
ncbi:MAG: tagaturonate epimerase family protein [Verrucomicrobiota bacterium]